MNIQRSLIQKLMLHKFELDHNIAEATKNIYSVKSEGAVDHRTVIKWCDKFRSGLLENLFNPT